MLMLQRLINLREGIQNDILIKLPKEILDNNIVKWELLDVISKRVNKMISEIDYNPDKWNDSPPF